MPQSTEFSCCGHCSGCTVCHLSSQLLNSPGSQLLTNSRANSKHVLSSLSIFVQRESNSRASRSRTWTTRQTQCLSSRLTGSTNTVDNSHGRVLRLCPVRTHAPLDMVLMCGLQATRC